MEELEREDYIICRICEKDISRDEFRHHCSRCYKITELKSKLISLNDELSNLSKKALQMKREIVKKAVLLKKKTLTEGTLESYTENLTTVNSNPSIGDPLPKDMPALKKATTGTFDTPENETKSKSESPINHGKIFSSIENDKRSIKDVVEEEIDQFHLLVLRYITKYPERLSDMEDLDCIKDLYYKKGIINDNIGDLNIKREIENSISKVEKKTLNEFLRKFLISLDKKIKVKMELSYLQDNGSESYSNSPCENRVRLFRSLSEKRNNLRFGTLIKQHLLHQKEEQYLLRHEHHDDDDDEICQSEDDKQDEEHNHVIDHHHPHHVIDNHHNFDKHNMEHKLDDIYMNNLEQVNEDMIYESYTNPGTMTSLCEKKSDPESMTNLFENKPSIKYVDSIINIKANEINEDYNDNSPHDHAEHTVKSANDISLIKCPSLNFQDKISKNYNTHNEIYDNTPTHYRHQQHYQQKFNIMSASSPIVAYTSYGNMHESRFFTKKRSRTFHTKKIKKIKTRKRYSSLVIIKSPELYADHINPEIVKAKEHISNANKRKGYISKPNLSINVNVTSHEPSKDLRVIYESPSNKGYFSDTSKRRELNFTLPSENTEENITIDDFEFIKMIGKGGYGRVWIVKKKKTGDIYAMKIIELIEMLHGNRLANLKAERDIFKILEGDFVVKGVFTFIYQHYLCFVMEYMVGGDFGKILEKFGYLSEDVARFYFAELVLAVESLHSLGIIHRDLKPENFLLDKNGHIKLADFGLSEIGFKRKATLASRNPTICLFPKLEYYKREKTIKLFNNRCKHSTDDNIIQDNIKIVLVDDSRSLKRAQEITSSKEKKGCRIIGTPDYIAPEVIRGEHTNSFSIDWWSMGVILYEFVVGIPPFNDETVEQVFDNIKNQRMEWPSIGIGEDCITPALANLIRKFLDPNPKTRLGSNGTEEIKNHSFFSSLDWDKVKTMQPPIKLYEINDNISSFDLDEEIKSNPNHDLVHFKDNILPKSAENMSLNMHVDINSFKMKRVDFLHHLNQQEVLKNKEFLKECKDH